MVSGNLAKGHSPGPQIYNGSDVVDTSQQEDTINNAIATNHKGHSASTTL